ncbi:MAG: glycosyltransferase [Thermoanaerobaculia bacterium]|nr:glycosyltransferase [Thermoanaerobaculia bacterium]
MTLVAPVTSSRLSVANSALADLCKPQLVTGVPHSLVASVIGSWRHRLPLGIARHRQETVVRRVEELLAAESFDWVHCEQLQALGGAIEGAVSRLPLVLRAQNIESDLWRASVLRRRGGRLLLPWVRRMARWEGAAVGRAALTLALSAEDGARLRRLSRGAGRVEVQAVPFPADLPPGSRVSGGSDVVLFAGGWWPNRDGATWFVEDGWPEVRRQCSGATLRLFGGARVGGDGIEWSQAPERSDSALAEGSILVVPLRVASGIRMKILEAWSRGVPVVATPVAASGLGATAGVEFLAGETPLEIARELGRLLSDSRLRANLVEAGRKHLQVHHDPSQWADRYLSLAESVVRS